MTRITPHVPPTEIAFPDVPFPLDTSLILLTRRGSEANGLVEEGATPDHDLVGVCVPPLNHYIGLGHWETANSITGEWDVVLHEARKAVRLLMAQNPDLLTLLWCEQGDVVQRTLAGEILRRQGKVLLRHVCAREKFVGFANSQLQKMVAFDRPTMELIDGLERRLVDAGLDPQAVVTSQDMQFDPSIQDTAKEYRHLRQKYRKSYMGAKRWALVRTVGYDSKMAFHAVRLLHQGWEYLTTGTLHVRRTWDRPMLLAIKRGEWPLEDVQRYADARKAEIDDLVEFRRHALPTSLDEDAIDKMLVRMVEMTHRRQIEGRSDG